jgi:hypothetical protein
MTLDELLAQYQPNPDDLRRQKQAALGLNVAAGLLGAQRGQELRGIGVGLLGATREGQNIDQSARMEQLRQMQLRSTGMDYLGKQDAFNTQQKVNAAMAQYQPQSPMQQAMGSAPSLAPTQQNVAQVSANAQQGTGEYERLIGLAKYLESKGLPQAALPYYAQAEKYAPQFDGTETLTVDNKPVVYQKFKNRPGQVLPGLQPKPEYKEVSDGQSKFFYDPLSQQKSGSFQMQLSPGEVQTGAHQNATLAETIRNNNATKALGYAGLNQSERHFQAGQDKPQIVSGANGEILAVNPRAGTGDLVRGPDGQPLSKGDKPLTESQAKATAYANQMADASAQIAKLHGEGFQGNSAADQVKIANAGAQGIPFVPGSAAIPRAMAGEKAQRFQQAELQWTEAALRFMTGASAPKEEVVRNADTYFPRPGDLPARVRQKEESRAAMERSIRMAAGATGNKQLPAMPTDSADLHRRAEAIINGNR